MDKILLASKSPRRIEILGKYCDLEIVPAQIDEVCHTKMRPEEFVMALSLKKALHITHEEEKKGLIIAADTIVYKDDILEKPKDRNDAFRMLKSLSGDKHYVYTGFSIMDEEIPLRIIDYDVTEVEFYDLGDDTINSYLDTEEYVDKAGAYGIQGYGELLVKSVKGSYANVVGLPMGKINQILIKYFNKNLLDKTE
ncbi:septum formation protein [Dethiosulfatibacter aminovorans DSM 17477]|uniref:dTTP/UTP pyrophosphatase n=1 Tax=Dethiosulfatibacter aminovorans DSM 17477 TaxID=1121476 RepID=A0A1M6KIP6_9FIRM|nr:Maf family protein [Dethiosulfatibacter aminovorans]SHJ58741.1 septum formation protein [Dethiosulfatibacter aminovorans DSM 17477]